MTTNGKLPLSKKHFAILSEKSAISDEVIEQRGYFTITKSQQARELGFSSPQASTISEKHPALIIPYRNPDGSIATYCMRPDAPRSIDDKDKKKLPDGTYPQKVFKYELPKGAGNVLDCHPAIIPHLDDPGRPLVFCEGAKKADALISKGYLAIGLNGVWGWRGRNERQGRTALAAFDDIALNGRKCILLFDTDVRTNDNVKSALRRLKSFLEHRQAIVTPVFLPPSNGEKFGIDDWFASGKTSDDLEAIIALFEVFEADLGQASGKRQWKTEQIWDVFRELGYSFSINSMNEAIELNGKLLDDTKMMIIESRLRDENVPIEHAKAALTVAADLNRYHPIKTYLDGLEWNGHDNIDWLAQHFTDEENVFGVWLKRWLIGCVAKVMGDGKHQNFMLVLDGKQGIGKSHFARWLCPLEKYFLESPLNPDDKDVLVRLMSSWIWEVGEIGSVFRRADREALKRIISMRNVTVRRAYGRFDIEKPAIANFIGTVNDENSGFLNDPTGSRRYAVTTLTAIDWRYTKECDVNQVWAEAYHLYTSGEPWELRGDEARVRTEINETYEVIQPIEGMLQEYFIIDPSKEDEPGWQMATHTILGLLSLPQDSMPHSTKLGIALKRLGLGKAKRGTVNKERVRVYRGIKYLSK